MEVIAIVNRPGNRIFHVPGGRWYAKVNMTVPGKRRFCSATEAAYYGRPAGFRRVSSGEA